MWEYNKLFLRQKVIVLKQILKIKYQLDNLVAKFKARLVIQRFCLL